MLQRLRCWVENLGFLFVLAIFAVVAMSSFCGLGNGFACRALALCSRYSGARSALTLGI
jgi:hypothetical protein